MNQISSRLIGILLFFLTTASVQAINGGVRLIPDKEIARIGKMSEPLSVENLIRASLIASDIGSGTIGMYTEKMNALLKTLPGRSGSALEDAEMILGWMHEHVLDRYVRNQTSLSTVLDRGTYNCVSSAVLYLILVRHRDIPVHGVLTADHAFCRVKDIDVETTTVHGFDPGTRREALDAFSGKTGFNYIPSENYRQRQNIGEKELISLIYQNRLAELQKRRRWDEAVGVSLDRWILAGSKAANNDFRVSIVNYAADLDRKKMDLKGLIFLNEAVLILGEDHGLENTASILLGNAVTWYLREGNIEEAKRMLGDREFTSLVPENFIHQRMQEVREKSLGIILKSASFHNASTELGKAYSDGLVDDRQWEKLTVYIWSSEARRRASGGKWLEGWRFLMTAPIRQRQIADWKKLEKNYRNNSIVVFHNYFADAVRKKDYAYSRRILAEALEYFPDSLRLKQDRAKLDRLQ